MGPRPRPGSAASTVGGSTEQTTGQRGQVTSLDRLASCTVAMVYARSHTNLPPAPTWMRRVVWRRRCAGGRATSAGPAPGGHEGNPRTVGTAPDTARRESSVRQCPTGLVDQVGAPLPAFSPFDSPGLTLKWRLGRRSGRWWLEVAWDPWPLRSRRMSASPAYRRQRQMG